MMHNYDPLNNPNGFMPDIPDMDKLTPDEQTEVCAMTAIIGCVAYALIFIVLLILCVLFGSCTTTRYVPIIEHHTDTLIHTQHHRDSIYLRDSIYVSEQQKGDTILLTTDRWHTLYRDRWQHDTTYISQRDTIPQPYEVIKEVQVEKALTWWQQTRMHAGGIVIFLLIIFVVRKIYITLHPRL